MKKFLKVVLILLLVAVLFVGGGAAAYFLLPKKPAAQPVVNDYSVMIADLQSQNEINQNAIDNLEELILLNNSTIFDLQSQLEVYQNDAEKLDTHGIIIANLFSKITVLEHENTTNRTRIQALENAINENNQLIEELSANINNLENIGQVFHAKGDDGRCTYSITYRRTGNKCGVLSGSVICYEDSSSQMTLIPLATIFRNWGLQIKFPSAHVESGWWIGAEGTSNHYGFGTGCRIYPATSFSESVTGGICFGRYYNQESNDLGLWTTHDLKNCGMIVFGDVVIWEQ